MLYKYNTLNKENFKSGRYVEFEEYSGENTTNISRYIYEGLTIKYIPKFYKLKLLHQLNNGYLDLTYDVWSKFVVSSRSTPFWFSNSEFLYYCPSQYKGKLVTVLEIEDLYKFSLYNLPKIEPGTSIDTYKFSINVDAISQNPSDILTGIIKISNGVITIPELRLETWYNDPTVVDTKYEKTAFLYDPSAQYLIGDIVFDDSRKYYRNLHGVNTPNLSDTNNWEPYQYLTIDNIPLSKKDSLLNYRITPVLSLLGETTLYEGTTKTNTIKDLPDEFINKYSIVGSIKITTEYDNIVFEKVKSNYTCDLTRGVKIYNEYILKNTSGLYLNNNLEVSDIPYIFLREGSTSQISNITPVVIGSYTLFNKKPELKRPVPISIDEFVLELFEINDIEEQSPDCVLASDATLNINFNINMNPNTQVKLYQDDVLIYSINNVSTSGISPKIPINKATKIEVQRPGYKSIIETISAITEETTILLAFIADVFIYHPSDTTYQLSWKGYGVNLPTFTNNVVWYEVRLPIGLYPAPITKITNTSMRSDEFSILNGNVLEFVLTQPGIIDINATTYLNIKNSGTHVSYEGTIFTKYVK